MISRVFFELNLTTPSQGSTLKIRLFDDLQETFKNIFSVIALWGCLVSHYNRCISKKSKYIFLRQLYSVRIPKTVELIAQLMRISDLFTLFNILIYQKNGFYYVSIVIAYNFVIFC